MNKDHPQRVVQHRDGRLLASVIIYFLIAYFFFIDKIRSISFRLNKLAITFTTRTCLDRLVPCLYLTSIPPPARPFSYLTDCSGQPTTCTCTATCDLLEETMCDSQLDGNALCGFDYETRSKWVKNETVNGVQTMHYHYGDPLGQVTPQPPPRPAPRARAHDSSYLLN